MTLYFTEMDDSGCYPVEHIKDMMQFEGRAEITAHEAKRETNTPYFYCKLFDQVGEVGESCGKQCMGYNPRNGKSGRCKHSGYCYEQTGKSIRIILR